MRPKLQFQSDHSHEPEELRSKYRQTIHQQLAEQYFLPHSKSRAITRDYLAGVYAGEYFRVSLSDISTFNAGLRPKLMKKTP
jgi:hypothetical protein